MKNQPIAPIDVLNRLSGFHQYCLGTPRRLCYVSQSLCTLLGAEEAELLSEETDAYLSFLHPEDREEYESSLRHLSQTPQTKAIQVRFVRLPNRKRGIRPAVQGQLSDQLQLGRNHAGRADRRISLRSPAMIPFGSHRNQKAVNDAWSFTALRCTPGERTMILDTALRRTGGGEGQQHAIR